MQMDKELKQIHSNGKSTILLQITIYLLFGLGPLTGNVILVLFGALSSEFEVSATAVTIAISSFMFPFAIVQLFSGAISDIRGRIPVILFGLIIFGIGMAIAIFSTSLIVYSIANALGGIGFGFVNPVLIALMTDISKRSDIPKKMGFLGAVANLGVGLGPILAGIIIRWQFLYVIFIIIIVLGFTILFSLRKSIQNQTRDTQFKAFLNQLVLELKRVVVILLIISAILATLSYLAIITWTSRALSSSSIPKNLAGIIIGLAGIFGTISGFVMGFLIKKVGVRIALLTSMISVMISLFILMNIKNITSIETLPLVALGFIFTGIAGGAIIPAIMFYSQTLSVERRGALAGLATAGQFIGIALGPIIYGYFYDHGGISLVYLIILGVSVTFIIETLILYIVANKKKI